MSVTEDIDGADFYGEDSQGRLLTVLSDDRAFLAVVTRRDDHFFRVHIYTRGRELNYGGVHWVTVGEPSITDTINNAEAIARARLADAPSDEGP